MKTITQYQAFDGKMFDAIEQCKAHEDAHVESRLVGLTIEQVRAALARHKDHRDLADAIEAVGSKIANARREAGELRAVRKPKPEAPAVPAAEPAPPADPGEDAPRPQIQGAA